MKYSEIVGSAFYGIKVPPRLNRLIDFHFTASAHHHGLSKIARRVHEKCFHASLHRAHLKALMLLIYENGDFSNATDSSLQGMDKRLSWFPNDPIVSPHKNMFNSMPADPEYGIGENHPADSLLDGIPSKAQLIH